MALDSDPGSDKARSDTEWQTVQPRSLIRAQRADRAEPVRVWTPVGTVDAGAIADVDPTGLVQMRGATWSFDWWIGAEDRWHFPSQEESVTQRLSGSSPVVETIMHVPGGDIIHRAYGVRAKSTEDGSAPWDGSGVIVEVENSSAVPVALAFAVRPIVLDGDGSVHELGVDGPVISVDGRVGAVLSRPVVRRVVGPPGTAAIRVGMADDEEPGGVWSVEGQMAEGAYVVPLSHTAVVRVLLPLVSRRSTPKPFRSKGSTRLAEPGRQWDAPGHEPVSAGWATHTRAAASVVAPEKVLAEIVTVSERLLLIASSDSFFEGDGISATALRNAELCEALARTGLREPLMPLATALVEAQRMGGAIGMPDRSDATVALIHAAAPLLSGSRPDAWVEELIGPVAKAIHRLGRGKGLDHGRGFDSAWTDFMLRRSAVTALARIASVLRFVGQPGVADAAAETAGTLRSAASTPPEVSGVEGACAGSDPISSSIFLRGLQVRFELAAQRSDALGGLLEFAARGHLGGIGDLVDPHGLPSGSMGLDPAAVAVRLSGVLDLVLAEGVEGPIVAPVWPVSWFGAPLEVHGFRTSWGVVSYAIRWHGDRPALLWEIEPSTGAERDSEPLLTAPGLDPTWTGRGLSGDALLAPVAIPDELREAREKPPAPRTPVQLSMKRKPG